LSKLSLHQIELNCPAETLPQLTAEQIAEEVADNEENYRVQITKLETQLSNMKPNLAAIAEYRKKVCVSVCLSVCLSVSVAECPTKLGNSDIGLSLGNNVRVKGTLSMSLSFTVCVFFFVSLPCLQT